MVDLATNQGLLVLIASDPNQARLIASSVSRYGWRTVCSPTPQQASTILDGLRATENLTAILDGWPGGKTGSEAIEELRRHDPNLPVLVLSSSSEVSHAIEAMRSGATDYLVRPFSPDRLLGALRMATSRGNLRCELQPLSHNFDLPLGFEDLVGTDLKFRAAVARAALAARGSGHVLVEGEGGTGRTTLLRALHAASPRSSSPFKIVNMRSYSESALTSALFGHEKGAFPGAFAKHVGALQHCYGGTLLLQEVNRMPASVQQRLAAALSDGRLRPLGASHTFDLNVRILATSNQPLNEMIEADRFRADLSEVLSATQIEVPPLRERVGDIPALSRFFLSVFQDRSRAREVTINDGAYDRLCSYDWPGNIRQLRSVLLRAWALCDGDALTADHFPALEEFASLTSPGDFRARRVPDGAGVALYGADGHLRTLEQIEADVIRLAIGQYSGRMTEIARRLRIGRSTLYRKLNDLDVGLVSDRGHG